MNWGEKQSDGFHKDVYNRMSRTRKYVILHGQGEFTYVISIMGHEMEGSSWINLGAPIVITWVLKILSRLQ